MRNKKLLIGFLCIIFSVFILGVTGVTQLAGDPEESNGKSGNDKLVGVFVTESPLDLFDEEGYFDKNATKILKGKEIGTSEMEKFQGRMYARRIEKDTGIEDKDYVFDGIEGIQYFAAFDENDGVSGWSVFGNEAVTDSKMEYNVTDSGEGITLEGTIYAICDKKSRCFYVNPVYQTAEGEIYTVVGNGMMYDSKQAPGVSSSQELKEKTTIKVGKEVKSFDTTVKITIEFREEPVEVKVLQFNKKHEMIKEEAYEPGTLAEPFCTLSETDYLIVETRNDSKDPVSVSREIYQHGDEQFYAFHKRRDGICIRQECQIQWGKAGNQEVEEL